VDDDITRRELISGGAIMLGAHTVLAAFALLVVLSSPWAGAVFVLLWGAGVLLTPALLQWLVRRYPTLTPVAASYRRLRLMYALILGYAVGTLGLTALFGSVQTVFFREEVVVRELLFSTALIVYMIAAALPGLLLLLAAPAWLMGLVTPWGLRFALAFAGFATVAMGAVVLVYGPVHLVTNVLGGDGPPGPQATGIPASLLFWGLYGILTLLSLFTTMIFRGWDGPSRPGRRQ
jgi:hypothetical protein